MKLDNTATLILDEVEGNSSPVYAPSDVNAELATIDAMAAHGATMEAAQEIPARTAQYEEVGVFREAGLFDSDERLDTTRIFFLVNGFRRANQKL